MSSLFDLVDNKEISYAIYMVSKKGCYYHINLDTQTVINEDEIGAQLKKVRPREDTARGAFVFFFVPGLMLEFPSCAFSTALIRLNALNKKAILYTNGTVWKPLSEVTPNA